MSKGANGFNHAAMLGANALEVQCAAFMRGQQGGDAAGGLGGGEVNHHLTRRSSFRSKSSVASSESIMSLAALVRRLRSDLGKSAMF